LFDDYPDLARDSEDDYYIDSMVEKINSAAIDAGYTELEKINFVISFVQNLPYTADNVSTPLNEYPKYPIETLFDRGGDCEDTSILVAALLDRLGYDVVLLILDNYSHCAVGINIDASGYYYMNNDTRYYYLETTGEGWVIGDMPEFDEYYAYIYPV
jgi:hypothetical protein